jgi:hypothetical protein
MTTHGGTSPAPGARPAAAESLVDRERRNPWLFWLIHVGLPMCISLVVHASLFIALGLTTWQVLTSRDARDLSATLRTTGGDPFATSFQWPGQEKLEDFTPEPPPELESLSDLRDLSRVSSLTVESKTEIGDAGGFGLGERGPLGLLGTGSGAPESGKGGGTGPGLGERPGIGRAGVWNVDVAANRVCYVVDFSGSTVGASDDLKRELKRSVGNLRAGQSFDVFVFYGKDDKYVTESFRPQLVPADAESKRMFFDWIDTKVANGHTEPLKAVERALKLGPDAIFFFSDGYFDDPKAVEKITGLNRRVGASIHCLVFDDILLTDTSDMPVSSEGAKVLKRVADQNGGKTKIITARDLAGR